MVIMMRHTVDCNYVHQNRLETKKCSLVSSTSMSRLSKYIQLKAKRHRRGVGNSPSKAAHAKAKAKFGARRSGKVATLRTVFRTPLRSGSEFFFFHTNAMCLAPTIREARKALFALSFSCR